MEDVNSVTQTFKELQNELEDVEKQLAIKLDIHPLVCVREILCNLDRSNQLIENELVTKWHELYSTYVDWILSEAGDK